MESNSRSVRLEAEITTETRTRIFNRRLAEVCREMTINDVECRAPCCSNHVWHVAQSQLRSWHRFTGSVLVATNLEKNLKHGSTVRRRRGARNKFWVAMCCRCLATLPVELWTHFSFGELTHYAHSKLQTSTVWRDQRALRKQICHIHQLFFMSEENVPE